MEFVNVISKGPKSAQAVGTTGIKLLNGSKEYITDSSCDLTIDKNAVPSKKRRKGSVERWFNIISTCIRSLQLYQLLVAINENINGSGKAKLNDTFYPSHKFKSISFISK